MGTATTASALPASSAPASSNKFDRWSIDRYAGSGVLSDVERIRSSLEVAAEAVQGGRVIAFASARTGEGKTTAMAALANHLVRVRGQSVLVVDGTGSQALAKALGLPQVGSLVDVEAVIAASGIHQGPSEGAKLVVAKRTEPPHSQADPLHNPATVERLRRAFDYVLIEFPSFAQSADVVQSVRLFTGVVLVIEAGQTRWQVVQNLSENIQAHGGKILGVILNRRRYYVPNWIYRWF